METKVKTTPANGGVGLLGWVFLIFLTMKLLDEMSWWWVTAPLWIPLVLMVAVVLIFGILTLVVRYLDRRARTKYRARLARRKADMRKPRA